MLFNSWVFVVFLVAVFALYRVLGRRAQNVLLLAASYVFYGYWDVRFLSLIAFSTVVDYAVGRVLERTEAPARRKQLLALSLATNLGLLGFFKYFNFFLEGAADVLALFGLGLETPALRIVLPVGISFYTFQTLSYTIDVYRRRIPAERGLVEFATFVSFFPQLVAGPIERASNFLPQLRRERSVGAEDLRCGLWLILKGYFLKLVIADNLALIVDRPFSGFAEPSGLASLFAIYAFAFQIYGDFAGYSNIARGVARCMGFELMRNFNVPYLARNPSDFWRRWHISLSTWLRDYLYVSLGGSREGRLRTYRNLMLTMVLGGLWHGAAWTFVAWGVFHGFILIVHRLLVMDRGLPLGILGRPWVSRFVVFHLVCFGWLLFRATSMAQVGEFLGTIGGSFFGGWRDAVDATVPVLFFAALVWALDLWSKDHDDPRRCAGWNVGIGPLAVSLMLVGLVVLAAPKGGGFLYFQF